MGTKKYKPNTPGFRQRQVNDYEEVTTTKVTKSLTKFSQLISNIFFQNINYSEAKIYQKFYPILVPFTYTIQKLC